MEHRSSPFDSYGKVKGKAHDQRMGLRGLLVKKLNTCHEAFIERVMFHSMIGSTTSPCALIPRTLTDEN